MYTLKFNWEDIEVSLLVNQVSRIAVIMHLEPIANSEIMSI